MLQKNPEVPYFKENLTYNSGGYIFIHFILFRKYKPGMFTLSTSFQILLVYNLNTLPICNLSFISMFYKPVNGLIAVTLHAPSPSPLIRP